MVGGVEMLGGNGEPGMGSGGRVDCVEPVPHEPARAGERTNREPLFEWLPNLGRPGVPQGRLGEAGRTPLAPPAAVGTIPR